MRYLLASLLLCLFACDATAQSMAGVSMDGVRVNAHAMPNILFIVADDFNKDMLDIYGASSTTTPALDTMASAGRIFDEVYATPICGSTRASILGGTYTHRNRVNGPYGVNFVGPTIFDALPHYYGWVVGKGGLGGYVATEDQQWHEYGARRYLGPLGPDIPSFFAYTKIDMEADSFGAIQSLTDSAETAYAGDTQATDAVTMIGASPEPWIGYIGWSDAHVPMEDPEDDATCVAQADCFIEKIDHNDGNLATVLAAVDYGDTLVIWIADNGTWNAGKSEATEAGINVAMVASGWGVTAGSNITTLHAGVDIMATAIEAGYGTVPSGATIDGCSFLSETDPDGVFGTWTPCTHTYIYSQDNGTHLFKDDSGYKLYRTSAGVESLYYLPTDETTDRCGGDCPGTASGADLTAHSTLTSALDAELGI